MSRDNAYYQFYKNAPTLPISVIVTVGLTAFTLILCGPNSRAATLRSNFKDTHLPVHTYLVTMSRAPLVAQYTVWSPRAACEA